MKLIDLHKEWVKKGDLNGASGLCGAIGGGYILLFELLKPTKKELDTHTKDGHNWMWWGEPINDNKWGDYNSFRQTIVLLICAMNNEL